MDYDQLLTFKTVAKLKNYSKAARELNLTQPAVTARIQSLEAKLDCNLFQRKDNQLCLTQEGEIILSYADKILSYMDEATKKIQLLKVPKLTIGLSPAFSIPIILNTLSDLQANQQLSLNMIEGRDTPEIYNKVINDEAELGLVRNLVPFPYLEAEMIYQDKLIFIVNKNHPLAAKEEITSNDLVDQTLICYLRHTPLWMKIDERLTNVNLKRVETTNFEMLKSMVRQNWGFSIIPELASRLEISHAEQEDIRIKRFKDIEDISISVMGIYKKDSANLENIHSFLRIFRDILNKKY